MKCIRPMVHNPQFEGKHHCIHCEREEKKTTRESKKSEPDTRFKRYLWGTIGIKGKHTVRGSKKCDKCGAKVSARNTNHSKWGKHIILCNGCKNREMSK